MADASVIRDMRIHLFRLFGIPIRLHPSWFIILFLLTWSLADGLFKWVDLFGELSASTRWTMGVLGALGLFASILIHELSHALTARRDGIPMEGITLFLFGGVAEMRDEPPSGVAELRMAIAGPAASIVIAVTCGLAAWLAHRQGLPGGVVGLLGWLAAANALLVAFNMIPAFPLDGGRVLRALLWAWRDDLTWATRISATIGGFFGLFLIVTGALQLLGGNILGGAWWILIGYFVRVAARQSYEQVLVRGALDGERVSRFMTGDPISVTPWTSVESLVHDYVYQHHFKLFPVVEAGVLLGCVSTRQIKEVPRHMWRDTTVGDLLVPCGPENTISPDAGAIEAVTSMTRTGSSRLLVAEDRRLVGVLALKDLLKFIAFKIELETNDPVAPHALGPAYQEPEHVRQ